MTSNVITTLIDTLGYANDIIVSEDRYGTISFVQQVQRDMQEPVKRDKFVRISFPKDMWETLMEAQKSDVGTTVLSSNKKLMELVK